MIKRLLKTDTLPQNITSYDLLKTLAMVLMIVDHVGAYFFPENEWLRAVGRLCVPMWLFLIGYARTRDIPFMMWSGALILLFANFMVGMPILAANILVTMIFVRLTLDFFADKFLKSVFFMVGLSFLMFLLAIPSMLVTEYGVLGLMFALCGYFLRNQDEVRQKGWNENFPFKFIIFTAFLYALQQQLDFGFGVNSFAFVAGGAIAVGAALMRFKPLEFPDFTQKLPGLLVAFFHLLGRRTLEIYVLHLIAFKVIALYLGYDGYEYMRFLILPEGLFDPE